MNISRRHWTLRTKRDTTGAEIENSIRFLKAYVAFNADQIEGLPERFHPAALDQAPLPLEAHEAWFSKLDIARIQSRGIACYVPSRDVIAMPPLAAFDTTESYARNPKSRGGPRDRSLAPCGP